MRQKQYLCALRPHDGALVLETMRYADEVVKKSEAIEGDVKVEVNAGELKMAQQLIAQHEGANWPRHGMVFET